MLAGEYLKCIGDFERIADHGVNIVSNVKELRSKEIVFSPQALSDLKVISTSLIAISKLTLDCFINSNVSLANEVEPLEQVIDTLKEEIRLRHTKRMQQGSCSITAGFTFSDILTNLERASDHCSNIAGCVIDASQNNLLVHKTLNKVKNSDEFKNKYDKYLKEYKLDDVQS